MYVCMHACICSDMSRNHVTARTMIVWCVCMYIYIYIYIQIHTHIIYNRNKSPLRLHCGRVLLRRVNTLQRIVCIRGKHQATRFYKGTYWNILVHTSYIKGIYIYIYICTNLHTGIFLFIPLSKEYMYIHTYIYIYIYIRKGTY
jgi:hypothetical protein